MNILEKWQLVFNKHPAPPTPLLDLGYKLKMSNKINLTGGQLNSISRLEKALLKTDCAFQSLELVS